ncbi:AbrB/MazE/SpoVT family DNA-binding domain-containing protein [Candidatus Nitrosocosmicus arcticus]|nr:AbrB/MazE/SpoVT family DNA-binding domain-containing protein [Candidatus Nitrosocosmicus arcticus]
MLSTYQIAKIQHQGLTSLTVTIPKGIVKKLRLSKGDYIKIYLEKEKIVMQRNS